MSWPHHIKQDLLGGCSHSLLLHQELLYSGDRHTTKKSCCSNTLHHRLSNRFVWDSRVTIGGGKYTICSLNVKISWSPVSRLASVFTSIQRESTWKWLSLRHSQLSIHLDTGGVHLADTHSRLSLHLVTLPRYRRSVDQKIYIITIPVRGLTTFLHYSLSKPP